MRTLQQGTNDFTCMVMVGGGGTPMCADKNAMAWLHAVVSHGTPPNSTGFIYMLGGDEGASNTDPYATEQTASNHWVKTGPHVMIVGCGPERRTRISCYRLALISLENQRVNSNFVTSAGSMPANFLVLEAWTVFCGQLLHSKF
jgi:hypothetical protein